MQISIQIPDDIAEALCFEQPSLSWATLEALAIEGYRHARLSEHQVCRMLEFKSRMDVHEFLKRHQVPLNYSLADLHQDIQSLNELEARPPASA